MHFSISEDIVPQIRFPQADEHDETNQTEAALHLDELQSLQMSFEQETSQVEGDDEGSQKLDQNTRTDLLLALPT